MSFNPPNPGVFMGTISAAVVSLREDFQSLVNLNNYVTAMGGATFLEAASPAGLGLDSTDAATVIACLGNLAGLAAVYNGGQPGAALNYNTNSEPLWNGS